jgi:hypothetical protein
MERVGYFRARTTSWAMSDRRDINRHWVALARGNIMYCPLARLRIVQSFRARVSCPTLSIGRVKARLVQISTRVGLESLCHFLT